MSPRGARARAAGTRARARCSRGQHWAGTSRSRQTARAGPPPRGRASGPARPRRAGEGRRLLPPGPHRTSRGPDRLRREPRLAPPLVGPLPRPQAVRARVRHARRAARARAGGRRRRSAGARRAGGGDPRGDARDPHARGSRDVNLWWRGYRGLAPLLGAVAPVAGVFTSPAERVLWRERLGRLTRPGGCDAWVHAASLGEGVAAAIG